MLIDEQTCHRDNTRPLHINPDLESLSAWADFLTFYRGYHPSVSHLYSTGKKIKNRKISLQTAI